MAKTSPDPRSHKLYFDHGTQGLDAWYEPQHMNMDQHLRPHGYAEAVAWITREFEGADPIESAWRARGSSAEISAGVNQS